MYSITNLKNGTKITIYNEPFVVLKYEHSQQGRGGAVVKTHLKNLITGATLMRTFQGNDKIEPADIRHTKAQFVYADGDMYTFMDDENYEQFELSKEVLSDIIPFLKEGDSVDVMNYNDNPINIVVKAKVELKVIETPPGVKGDTVSGGTKPATLETGLIIQVPLFINVDDEIRVNTAEKTYVERVKK